MMVLAWYVQIHPGHLIAEGGRPALATSLGDALTTAPLFAFYEGMWFLGLRKDFHKQVLAQVDQKTRELCRAGEKMRLCESVYNEFGDPSTTMKAFEDVTAYN
jgi:2-hydroxy fatty acid dioxygenase